MPGKAGRLAIMVVLALVPCLLGMGSSSEGPTKIPEPQYNYQARVTDQQGVRVELTWFSIEGMTFVQGKLGQGQTAIPLEKVREVTLSKSGDQVLAHIVMKQGSPLDLHVKPTLKAFGKTSYGNYSITLGELARVEIMGLVKK